MLSPVQGRNLRDERLAYSWAATRPLSRKLHRLLLQLRLGLDRTQLWFRWPGVGAGAELRHRGCLRTKLRHRHGLRAELRHRRLCRARVWN